MNRFPLQVVILAAGQGKRMNSDLPKVLHQVAAAPLHRAEPHPGGSSLGEVPVPRYSYSMSAGIGHFSRFSSCSTCCCTDTSSALVGSSSTRMGASVSNARAMAMRCR